MSDVSNSTIEEMGLSPEVEEALAKAGIRDLVDLATYNERRLRDEVGLEQSGIVEVKEVVVGAGLVPGMPREAALRALDLLH